MELDNTTWQAQYGCCTDKTSTAFRIAKRETQGLFRARDCFRTLPTTQHGCSCCADASKFIYHRHRIPISFSPTEGRYQMAIVENRFADHCCWGADTFFLNFWLVCWRVRLEGVLTLVPFAISHLPHLTSPRLTFLLV